MSRSTDYRACRPEQLPLYHYGELQAEERLRLDEHLRGCAACRQELAELRTALGRLPAAADLDLPPAALRAFRQRLDRRLRPRSRRPAGTVLGWSFAATTAVLALVVWGPRPGPVAEPAAPKMVRQIGAEMEGLPDAELLLNLELLENLDLLQELKGLG